MKEIRVYITVLLLTVVLAVSAQSMTFNHDAMIMNQFTKAEMGTGELGGGTLLGGLYYDWFHDDYQSMANNPINNKLAARGLTYAEVNKEEIYAENIKDTLTKRAELEALNVADRELDVEWLVEKSKIKRVQDVFKKNIESIVAYGGTSEDKTSWTQIYNCVQQSLDSAHDAYMPNSQRKAVYVLLYKDLCKYNSTLNKLKNVWFSRRYLREHEDDAFNFVKTRSHVKDCYGRWKLAWGGKKTNSGGSGGGHLNGEIGIDAGQMSDGQFHDSGVHHNGHN